MAPRRMIILLFILLVFVGNTFSEMTSPLIPKDDYNMNQVEHGRYLTKIAGCNDCHTAGYLLSEGKVTEDSWLTGDTFGWRGPWGTTYATNLRVFINSLKEDQWVVVSHSLKARPPMPWFNLNATHDDDLKAIYQFVRYLGPVGELAPDYLPPDIEPKPPYALFPSPP